MLAFPGPTVGQWLAPTLFLGQLFPHAIFSGAASRSGSASVDTIAKDAFTAMMEQVRRGYRDIRPMKEDVTFGAAQAELGFRGVNYLKEQEIDTIVGSRTAAGVEKKKKSSRPLEAPSSSAASSGGVSSPKRNVRGPGKKTLVKHEESGEPPKKKKAMLITSNKSGLRLPGLRSS